MAAYESAGRSQLPTRSAGAGIVTWELAQKYFLDPTFGGALVPGQRNVFTTTSDLTGIAFLTEPRHLSPLVSRLKVARPAPHRYGMGSGLRFSAGPHQCQHLSGELPSGRSPSAAGMRSCRFRRPARLRPRRRLRRTTFQQFRVAPGLRQAEQARLQRRPTSFGFDSNSGQLQFATAQTTYNWDCCGMTLNIAATRSPMCATKTCFASLSVWPTSARFGNLRRKNGCTRPRRCIVRAAGAALAATSPTPAGPDRVN